MGLGHLRMVGEGGPSVETEGEEALAEIQVLRIRGRVGKGHRAYLPSLPFCRWGNAVRKFGSLILQEEVKCGLIQITSTC